MADEATIRCSLHVVKGSLVYQSNPTGFRADVNGAKGPTPGAIAVPLTGVAVSFSELTTPGLCRLMNLEAAGGNYFEFGIRDPGLNVFYPLGEVLPGESYVLRLTRNLLEEYSGTGTGTTTPGNQFWLKANGAALTALVEAFEK